MKDNKLIDCVTFFDNKLMFDLRFNILKDHVDFFVVCESKYDHRNNPKKLKAELLKYGYELINNQGVWQLYLHE